MFDSEAATLHTLHGWIPLSSEARGYISVPDYEAYHHLPTPFELNLNRTADGPGYMISMFHQLHCLVRPASPRTQAQTCQQRQ